MAQTKVKLISDGVIDVGHLASGHGITTDNIGEGSNLYYTDARVSTYLSTNSYATEGYVTTAVANLVDSAPTTLDTLNELAAALGDDPNFATTVTNSIATKLPLAGGTLTGTLYAGGLVRLTGTTSSNSQLDLPVDWGALRWYDGTTFKGGIGTAGWSGVGSGNDLTVYLNNGNFHVSNNTSPFVTFDRANERVGIGTTSPTHNLHVYDATTNVQATFESGDATVWINLKDSASGTYGVLLGAEGSDFIIAPNNNRTAVFKTNGDVGIGTTSPAYKLQVNGDMRVTSNVRLGTDLDTSVTIGQAQNSQSTSSDTKLVLSGKNLEAGGTYYGDYGQLLFNATANYTGSARKWLITNGLDAYKFSIIMGDSGQVTPIIGTAGGISNGTPVITMDDSARVGIGTTLPDQKFHVNGGTTNVVAHFQSTDSVGGIKLSDSTGNVELTTNSSSGFDIRPNGGSAVFTITSGGNVGINTTSPAADLDVNGSTRFRGDTYNEYTFTASGNYTSGTWYDAADTSTLTANGIYIIQMYLDDYGAGGGTYFCWYVSVPFMWVTTGTNRTTTINFPELIGTGHATGTLPTFRLT